MLEIWVIKVMNYDSPCRLMFSNTFDRNIPAEGREKVEKSPLTFVT